MTGKLPRISEGFQIIESLKQIPALIAYFRKRTFHLTVTVAPCTCIIAKQKAVADDFGCLKLSDLPDFIIVKDLV